MSVAAVVVAGAAAWVGRAPAPKRLTVDPIAGQHRASYILTELLRETPLLPAQNPEEALASAEKWAGAAASGQAVGLYPSDLSDQDGPGARTEIFDARRRLHHWLMKTASAELEQGNPDESLRHAVLSVWVAQAGKSSSWPLIADSGQMQVRSLRIIKLAALAASPEAKAAAKKSLDSALLREDALQPLDRHLAVLTAGDFAAAALQSNRPSSAAEQAKIGVQLHRADLSAYQGFARESELRFQAELEAALKAL